MSPLDVEQWGSLLVVGAILAAAVVWSVHHDRKRRREPSPTPVQARSARWIFWLVAMALIYAMVWMIWIEVP